MKCGNDSATQQRLRRMEFGGDGNPPREHTAEEIERSGQLANCCISSSKFLCWTVPKNCATLDYCFEGKDYTFAKKQKIRCYMATGECVSANALVIASNSLGGAFGPSVICPTMTTATFCCLCSVATCSYYGYKKCCNSEEGVMQQQEDVAVEQPSSAHSSPNCERLLSPESGTQARIITSQPSPVVTHAGISAQTQTLDARGDAISQPSPVLKHAVSAQALSSGPSAALTRTASM